MTTSTYFPQQLLTQSIEERVAYFENKIIAHPKLSDLYREILDTINHPVDVSLLMIYGPTGVGKTTLRQRLQRELMAAAQAEPDRKPGHIPVVGLEVALPENHFNWSDYYRRALKVLNEPLIGDKIEYGQRGIEYNAAGELIFVYTVSVTNLRHALEQALKHRQPKAFFVDEAQHFNKVASGRRLLDQMDTLKSLTSLTNTLHVLLGTYDLLDLTDLSAQLSRRTLDFHFSRYRADVPEEMMAFQNVILTFQRHLPLSQEPNLVQHGDYLYEKSVGCVGILKNLLLKSLKAALKGDCKTITLETLEQCAIPTPKLLQFARHIKEGEADLAEKETQLAELRTMLGLSLPTSSLKPQNSHGSAKKAKTRVGQRNPVRDTVGVK
jgi:DNA polymerase III delta prime subunit